MVLVDWEDALIASASKGHELGVKLHFEHEIRNRDEFKDADLMIACDGIQLDRG